MKALESDSFIDIKPSQAKLATPVLTFLLTFSLFKRNKPSLLGIWRRIFQSHNCYSAGEEGFVKNTLTKINILNCSEQRDVNDGEYKAHGTLCSITLIRNVFS